MADLCEIGEKNKKFFWGTSLFDFPDIKGVYMPGTREVLHCCHHFFEPSLGLDKYVEYRIYPIISDDNRLVYYIATNRDITAERNMYLKQREHDRKLQATNDAINRYERQLHYLLEETQMYIFHLQQLYNH